jgi:WD repeat-containing protein 76
MPPKRKEEKKEAELSEFELFQLQLERNKAENKAIIGQISKTSSNIIPKAKPAAPKPKRSSAPRVKRETPQRESPRIATRQSSRLAGLDADSPASKRKAEVEAEVAAEQARAKKMRVSGDLSLGDIAVEGHKYEGGVEGLASLKGLRGAQPGVRTFTEDDVHKTTDKGLKDLRLRMSGLKLYEKWSVSGK